MDIDDSHRCHGIRAAVRFRNRSFENIQSTCVKSAIYSLYFIYKRNSINRSAVCLFYGVPVLLDYLNPRFGWELNADNISPLIYALIAYTINTTAYQAEIFRASINATSAGQMEAAYSVGMTTAQGLYRIILPQAFLVALPNMGNLFINLIKATSLAFAVKVMEILAISRIIANDGYRFLEMYLVASIIYWTICLVCEIAFSRLERKMSRFEARADLKAATL